MDKYKKSRKSSIKFNTCVAQERHYLSAFLTIQFPLIMPRYQECRADKYVFIIDYVHVNVMYRFSLTRRKITMSRWTSCRCQRWVFRFLWTLQTRRSSSVVTQPPTCAYIRRDAARNQNARTVVIGNKRGFVETSSEYEVISLSLSLA